MDQDNLGSIDIAENWKNGFPNPRLIIQQWKTSKLASLCINYRRFRTSKRYYYDITKVNRVWFIYLKFYESCVDR